MGGQKNCLNETVLLSTYNICFDWEIRKLFFNYSLLSKSLQNVVKIYTLQKSKNFTLPLIIIPWIWRILHKWSLHMKFIKQAFGQFYEFNMKWLQVQ